MKISSLLILLITPLILFAEKKEKPSLVEIEAQKLKVENILQKWKLRYQSGLKANPPLPPWLKFPEYSRYDVGWRMGKGEDYMNNEIGAYFYFASEKEKKAYQNKYPTPQGWEGWYEN